MGSWRYKWPNGTTSFVSADTRDDAVFLLDQIGCAEPSELKPITGGFFVDVRPTRRGWKLLSFDEESQFSNRK
jgi:hypothetical protein